MPAPHARIPVYRPKTVSRLPPAKLALFRSVVAHPPPAFAAPDLGDKSPSTSASATPIAGAQQFIYTTSPRPLIPLTMSPFNHRLWNPPAADAVGSRVVERDESGRLARFANRFAEESTTLESGVEAGVGGEDNARSDQFAPEADLSFLEGETLQSPSKALGKRDIVGSVKTPKKGKK